MYMKKAQFHKYFFLHSNTWSLLFSYATPVLNNSRMLLERNISVQMSVVRHYVLWVTTLTMFFTKHYFDN